MGGSNSEVAGLSVVVVFIAVIDNYALLVSSETSMIFAKLVAQAHEFLLALVVAGAFYLFVFEPILAIVDLEVSLTIEVEKCVVWHETNPILCNKGCESSELKTVDHFSEGFDLAKWARADST